MLTLQMPKCEIKWSTQNMLYHISPRRYIFVLAKYDTYLGENTYRNMKNKFISINLNSTCQHGSYQWVMT